MAGKRQRILALDLLRGYFVSIIVIDHVAHFPGLFEYFTGRGQLWVSAAEGFFIISGMLVGYIYGPKMQQQPKSVTLKLWKRAAVLYAWTVAATLIFTWWGNFVGHSAHIKTMIWEGGSGLTMLSKALTLQYVYGWADFLSYYVIFMLLAPLAVWLITKRRAWVVLAISVAWWFFRRELSIYDGWQLLFMAAVVAGYYLPQIESLVRSLRPETQKQLQIGLTTTTVLALAASAMCIFGFWYVLGNARDHIFISQGFSQTLKAIETWYQPYHHWFDKNTLGPGRLLLDVICFPTFYLYFRKYEQQIEARTRGFFRVLGENSLFAYLTQAAIVFSVDLMWSKDIGRVWNVLINAGSVALVYWLCLHRKTTYSTVRRILRKMAERFSAPWVLPEGVLDE